MTKTTENKMVKAFKVVVQISDDVFVSAIRKRNLAHLNLFTECLRQHTKELTNVKCQYQVIVPRCA